MAMTGAEVLVEGLTAAGVRHLFSLSGNQILSVYDATIGRDIELIHTRHEAAAVHMADGWGRLTGEPGIALLTAGPGHCNGLSALYVALMAESPVVMLSGHCPETQIGRGAFQEMDQAAAARPVAKASWRVERREDLASGLSRALGLAVSGRPGPVHLSLPSDVLEASAPGTNAAQLERTEDAADANPDTVLDLLGHAERPLILAGPAMARATALVGRAGAGGNNGNSRAAHGKPARRERSRASTGGRVSGGGRRRAAPGEETGFFTAIRPAALLFRTAALHPDRR